MKWSESKFGQFIDRTVKERAARFVIVCISQYQYQKSDLDILQDFKVFWVVPKSEDEPISFETIASDWPILYFIDIPFNEETEGQVEIQSRLRDLFDVIKQTKVNYVRAYEAGEVRFCFSK
jgi:hypothetical protein